MKKSENIVKAVEERLWEKMFASFTTWLSNYTTAQRPTQWKINLAQKLLDSRNLSAGDRAVIIFEQKVQHGNPTK